MNCITRFSSPQLRKLHSGKVRESLYFDETSRLILVTDRISAFDQVLNTPIPQKGAVLNLLANYWFKQTEDLVPNHFLRAIDENMTLVKTVKPIRLEMIVRGYLTGSMWRNYHKGQRIFSGVQVPDGLKKNQPFPTPILTPTTKEASDREISPQEIVKEGWTDAQTYQQLADLALKLFHRGQQLVAKQGLILVDTKYEFGELDGKILLIDEIHTPDSSRFWDIKEYQKDPLTCEEFSKELVRSWLLSHQEKDKYPLALPDHVVAETTKRYVELYHRITGQSLAITEENVEQRVYQNLLKAQLIKEGYVAIIMGSPADLEHAKKIKAVVEHYHIKADLRVVSAHKNGENIAPMVEEYNHSIEPGAVVAIAGLSNGLGGALAANLVLPVFNCPPFKDMQDLTLNINSSLMMPSKTPAATMIGAESAALAALRSLNLPRLRQQFLKDIALIKEQLRDADGRVRGQS